MCVGKDVAHDRASKDITSKKISATPDDTSKALAECDGDMEMPSVPVGAGPGGIFIVQEVALHNGAKARQGTVKDRNEVSPKPKVNFMVIKDGLSRGGVQGNELTWVNVEGVNPEILAWLEDNFHISAKDLFEDLNDRVSPSGGRHADYLILKFDELSLNKRSTVGLSAHVDFNRCVLVCADNFMISIARRMPICVARVWSEALSETRSQSELTSSNAIATRVIGSNLHVSEEVVAMLSDISRGFVETRGAKLPKAQDLAWTRAMSQHLSMCELSLESMYDVLHRLQESRNLFGRPKPCEEIGRYQRTVSLIDSRIEHTRRGVMGLEDAWRAVSAKWQGEVLYRLAILGGFCTPITVMSSVFGSNFSVMPPDTWMWGLLAGAVAVSASLVGALLYKKREAER